MVRKEFAIIEALCERTNGVSAKPMIRARMSTPLDRAVARLSRSRLSCSSWRISVWLCVEVSRGLVGG